MGLLAVIGVELVVIIVGGLWFMVALMSRPWVRNPISWSLLAWVAVGVVEAVIFLAALLGVPMTLWPFAIGFGLADGVAILRLALLYWARRADTRAREPAK